MSTRTKSHTKVASQGSDIGALGASHAEHKFRRRALSRSRRETKDLLFGEGYATSLELHLVVLAFASVFVGSVAIDPNCRERWRDLVNLASERVTENLLNEFTSDVGSGVRGVNFRLAIEAGRGLANADCGHILLIMIHKGLEAFGGLASADNDETRGKGIESASMTHLNLLDAEDALEKEANFIYGIERGPGERFIYEEAFSGNEIQSLWLLGSETDAKSYGLK